MGGYEIEQHEKKAEPWESPACCKMKIDLED